MASFLRLQGGRVIDPGRGLSGSIEDIWIQGGQIVAAPRLPDASDVVTMACDGCLVLPGGVDMHSHIVGPKINAARRLQPELVARRRSPAVLPQLNGRPGSVDSPLIPPVNLTAAHYLGMGYTSVMDAAIAPSASRLVHRELEQLPGLDVGFFVLCGNHEYLLSAVGQRRSQDVRHFLSWLLTRCGAWAPKLANPGGVSLWKRHCQGNVRDLSQKIADTGATPAAVIRAVAEAAQELKLPHPIHLHGLNLGIPGNWQTTLETMKQLDGLRAHLAHVQFHSYGGEGDSEMNFTSRVEPLAEWLHAHPELSVDVGQIMFGATTTMTADAPLGYALSRLTGGKWFSCDVEVETGCGVTPIEYKNTQVVHAWQWAIGLEWLLRVENPWQIALTTDHPNGGSFLTYPRLIRLLMDASFRREEFQRLPRVVQSRSPLRSMDREYTLEEIAIVTRCGPARLLGLDRKGTLAVGADADIAVYRFNQDWEQTFQFPWLVIKGGDIAVQDGSFRPIRQGTTWAVRSPEAEEWAQSFGQWFAQHYSLRMDHLGRRSASGDRFVRPLIQREFV